MASDSSEIDAAVLDKLNGDATLMALLPDRAYMDIAPANKTRFAIVSLVIAEDDYQFGGIAYERSLYLVKAVVKDTGTAGIGALVKSAASRIFELMQFQPLAVTGYAHMLTRRDERVRYTEVDSVNADIRWQHRGGRFSVFVSPDD